MGRRRPGGDKESPMKSLLLLTLLASSGAAPSPETVFSKSLRFTGDVVEVLPSGQSIRKTAVIRGRTFTWRGKVAGAVATPEAELDKSTAAVDVAELSLEELAQNLRALVLFNGHEFIESEPAYDLARTVLLHRRLELEGASAEELSALVPGVGPSQGGARSREQAKARGPAANIVQGPTDDRVVMDNTVHPFRAQIVFDNTGSTTVIEASQGSGTLIGPSTALSAAHVFWDETNDTWEAGHRWAPGYDSQDADPSPFGDWTGCYLVSIPVAYTNNVNQNTYDYAVLDFDVGCNSVDNGVNSDEPGNTVGWLGSWVAGNGDIQGSTGYVRGYPGTGTCGNPGVACNVRVWGDTSSASENNATANEVRHQADTSGGNSGSGFYQYADPTCAGCDYGAYVVGIHRAGSAPYNIARRYDSTVSAFMHANSSDY
jgi:V8-like Glu-specific endopeptidase